MGDSDWEEEGKHLAYVDCKAAMRTRANEPFSSSNILEEFACFLTEVQKY